MAPTEEFPNLPDVPRPETKLRLEITSQLTHIEKALNKPTVRVGRLTEKISDIKQKLKVLKEEAINRIFDIRTELQQVDAMSEFLQWEGDQLDILDELSEWVANKPGSIEHNETEVKISIAKDNVTSLTNQIDTEIAALNAEISAESDEVVLTPGVFTEYNAKVAVIRQHIGPDMASIVDKLKSANPAKITEIEQEYTEAVNN